MSLTMYARICIIQTCKDIPRCHAFDMRQRKCCMQRMQHAAMIRSATYTPLLRSHRQRCTEDNTAHLQRHAFMQLLQLMPLNISQFAALAAVANTQRTTHKLSHLGAQYCHHCSSAFPCRNVSECSNKCLSVCGAEVARRGRVALRS